MPFLRISKIEYVCTCYCTSRAAGIGNLLVFDLSQVQVVNIKNPVPRPLLFPRGINMNNKSAAIYYPSSIWSA